MVSIKKIALASFIAYVQSLFAIVEFIPAGDSRICSQYSVIRGDNFTICDISINGTKICGVYSEYQMEAWQCLQLSSALDTNITFDDTNLKMLFSQPKNYIPWIVAACLNLLFAVLYFAFRAYKKRRAAPNNEEELRFQAKYVMGDDGNYHFLPEGGQTSDTNLGSGSAGIVANKTKPVDDGERFRTHGDFPGAEPLTV